MKLTPSQTKALSTERHLAITANAGSGKTRVLVRRYVDLFLRYELTTRNVVAITFTDNAAAELRRRVSEEIAERLLEIPVSQRAERDRLRRLRESLPNAFIGTIHSFASRILRSYPVEANVDASFAIVLGADRRILEEDSISRVFYSTLEEAYSQNEAPPVLQLFRKFGRHIVKDLVRALLLNRARAERVRRDLLSKSDADVLSFWLEQIEAALSIVQDASLSEDLQELLPFVKRTKSGKPGAYAEKFITASDAHRTSAPFFEAVETFKQLVTSLLTNDGKVRAGVLDFVASPDTEAAVNAIIQKIVPFRKLLEVCPAGREAFETEHLEYLSQLRTVFALYDQVLAEYTDVKTQYGLLDFDDLIEGLLRLLEDTRVREEISSEFRFIMVDEYQDTDESQLELVRRLTAEFSQRTNLAIVGDPKQAIYTFRNADAAIFFETTSAIERQTISEAAIQESLALLLSPQEELGRITLGETFRMTQAPIAAINRLFGFVMDEQEVPFGRGRTAYSPLIHGRETESKGSVEWICPVVVGKSNYIEEHGEEENTSDENDEESSDTIEVELIARKIRGIVSNPDYRIEPKDKKPGEATLRPARYEDIAILIRSRTNLPMLEKALREEHIPYSVAKGTGFFEQPEILDITSYLNFLTVPTNDVALAAILRSPFFAVSDVELFQIAHHKSYERHNLKKPWTFWDQFQDYVSSHPLPHFERAVAQLTENLALTGRTSAAILVEKIYAETGIYATLQAAQQSTQKIANLEKFLTLARASDASGFSSLLDFVERITYLTESEDRESQADIPDARDIVQIMTVHEAKGLEFPIVILPFLQKQFNFDHVNLLDKELGLQIRPPEGMPVPIISKLISLRARAATIEEEKRIFYVAATRARDHLIFSCTMPEKPKRDSWLAWTMESFGLSAATESMVFDEQVSRYDGNLQSVANQDIQLAIPLIRSVSDIWIGEEIASDDKSKEAGPFYLSPLRIPRSTGRFSATQLLRHKECPTKYYLASVLGMPEEPKLAYDMEPEEYSERVRGSLLGQVVHKLLEKIIKIAPARALNEEQFSRELEAILEEIGIAGEQYSKAGRKHFDTFLTNKISSSVFDAGDSYAELPLQTSLQSGDLLYGIIDRLFRDKNGVWTILDYKTEDTSNAVSHEKSIERYKFQLRFYAYLVHLFDPDAVTIRGVLFFTSTGEVREFEFHSEDFEGLAEECAEIINQIRVEEHSPNLSILSRNADHCHECSYFNRAEGKCVVLAADQNPTEIPAR